MATILDVAARAGVGVGTVSRVINDSPQVSAETRSKVQAVIEELGYRPSAVARALSSGRTASVAVLAFGVTNPSVSVRLEGILSVLGGGTDVVICSVEDPDRRRELVIRHTQDQKSRGALAISLELAPPEVEMFADAGVPLVSLDFDLPNVPSVMIDDVAAGAVATKHLIDLGHERIAYLGDAETGDYRTRASAQRHEGYLAAMNEAGLEPLAGHDARVGEAGKKAAAAELFGLPTPPTAIFAPADTTALCVLGQARVQNLRVPTDLSVVGFDDLWAAFAAGLTTMSQPLFESGRLGAEALQALLGGGEVEQRVELGAELVLRSTTGPPA